MAENYSDIGNLLPIGRFSRRNQETDDTDTRHLIDKEEEEDDVAVVSNQMVEHRQMETTAKGIENGKDTNEKLKRGFRLLLLLLVLILISFVLYLVFRPNTIFKTNETEGNTSKLVGEFKEIEISQVNVTNGTPSMVNTTLGMDPTDADQQRIQNKPQETNVGTTNEVASLDGLLEGYSINVWKIEGLRKKLFERKGEIVSQVFPVDGYRFSIQVKLWWDEDRIGYKKSLSFELCFRENGPESNITVVEFPLVAYVFVDQSESTIKRDLTVIVENFITSPKMTFDTYGYRHGLYLWKAREEINRYCANDTTHIKIVVEDPLHAINSIQSYNGSLNWRIDGFSERRQDEMEMSRDYQYSVPFYSGNPGYKMRMILYANGEGSRFINGITMGVRIVAGRWDDSLPYEMTFTTVVTIEDQTSTITKKHLKISSVELSGKDGSYFIGFIPHNRIRDGVHLVNDSLSIKVVVTTT